MSPARAVAEATAAAAAAAPKHEDLCLTAGDRGATCLTPSQWGVLFGKRKKPRRYGCGSYACVYQSREKGKVVKITSDPGDVHTTRKAQGIPHVVTLYRAFDLGQHGGSNRYAMVLERLKPLREDTEYFWHDVLQCFAAYRHLSDVRCCSMREVKRKRGACKRLAAAVHDTKQQLASRGIIFSDWHGGNIGRDAQGNWKLLDLGFNVGYVEPPPKALTGSRRLVRRVAG